MKHSPFGTILDGRTFSSAKYRYGFNGMEKDDEAKGAGNSYDFGNRIYDPRLSRWSSPDPLSSHYPSRSVYQYCSNDPVYFKDKDGRVQTDPNGNIIYEVDVNKKPEYKTFGKYDVTIQDVYVFANSGEKIGGIRKYTVVDRKTGKEVSNTLIDVAFNCHGHSALNDKFRVNSDKNQSNELLKDKAGLKTSDDFKSSINSDFSNIGEGEIVVLFNSKGVAIHSYVYKGKDAKEDKVSSKNGERPMSDGEGKTMKDVWTVYTQTKDANGKAIDPDNIAVSSGHFKPVDNRIIETLNPPPNVAYKGSDGTTEKTDNPKTATANDKTAVATSPPRK